MEEKKLSYEELDTLFEEIKTGEKCIIVDSVVFVFKYPSKKDVEYCKRIQQIYTLRFKSKAPLSDEIPSFLSVSENQNLDIDQLEREKRKLERVVEDGKIIDNQQSLDFYRDKLKKTVQDLEQAKSIAQQTKSFDKFSLDIKVRNYIFYYLLRKCVYYYIAPNELALFFNNDIRRYSHWSSKLLDEFVKFYIGESDTILRQLARHPRVTSLWKISYNTGVGLFSGNASDYTPIQVKLCFWLGYYTDVFKNLGSPDSERMVEDDKAFDEWVKSKVKEMKSKKSDSSSNKSGDKGSSVNQHKIVFKDPTHASSKRVTNR